MKAASHCAAMRGWSSADATEKAAHELRYDWWVIRVRLLEMLWRASALADSSATSSGGGLVAVASRDSARVRKAKGESFCQKYEQLK